MRKKGTFFVFIVSTLISLLIACTPTPAPSPTTVIEIPTIVAQPIETEAPADPTATPVAATVPAATPTEVAAPIENPTENPTVTPVQTIIVDEPDTAVDMVVQFPVGGTGTALSGDVVVGQFDSYRLGAQANQIMSINLISSNPNLGFTLIGPGDGPPIVYGDAGFIPTSWSGPLPESGEYLIEVYSTLDPATYQLDIEILPIPVRSPLVPEGAELEELHLFGEYRFEIWRPFESASFGGNIGLLLQGDTVIAQLDNSANVDPRSGTDITGNGTLDLIIEGYSGGAHCCFSLDIFELGATANHALDLQSNNCGARLEDINGDGAFEVSTCDDSFAYRYCAYAGSPKVATYYEYGEGLYRPVTNSYASQFDAQIASEVERLSASSGSGGGWDNTNKCDVLGLTLVHLYTGNPSQAYQTLEQYYTGGDLNFFWADILNVIEKSEMYVPAGQMPEVTLPDYYQIAFANRCGQSDQFGLDLVVGLNGSDLCQSTIPVQSLSWLRESLGSTTLFEPFERLQLTPEGCTTDCRIEILKYDDAAQAETMTGYLTLINTDGQPTTVQRLNDAGEPISPQFALRGDLSWEQR